MNSIDHATNVTSGGHFWEYKVQLSRNGLKSRNLSEPLIFFLTQTEECFIVSLEIESIRTDFEK